MCRARSLDFLNLDLEIERTLRRLRRKRIERVPVIAEGGGNQNAENQGQRALRDYFRSVVTNNYLGLRLQTINANNFELKLVLINMVQQN